MATWYLGPLRFGQGIARKIGIGGGIAAIAGGLVLGVITAADPGAAQAAPPPPAQTGQGAAAAAQPARTPRLPLHQLLVAKVTGQKPATQPARPAQRMLIGRVLGVANGTATVRSAAGQTVTVHTDAGTKLPARRVVAGEPVVIIGKADSDGSFLARAILRRPTPLRPLARIAIAQRLRSAAIRRGTAPAQ